MKIELIKETNFAGEWIYYIKLDGKYIGGTMTPKEDRALEYYDFIKVNKGEKSIEVIKQTEI